MILEFLDSKNALFFTLPVLCGQEWFAVYVELNQQIATLLNVGEEEDVAELKALQQQLSDVCYRQATQLEGRQNVLQAAQGFHSTSQEVRRSGCPSRSSDQTLVVAGAATHIHMRLFCNNGASPASRQLSQQLDGLLGMLCADVAPADGASIQQNLKLLEEKLQSVGVCCFCWCLLETFTFIDASEETLASSRLSSRLITSLPV